LLGRERL